MEGEKGNLVEPSSSAGGTATLCPGLQASTRSRETKWCAAGKDPTPASPSCGAQADLVPRRQVQPPLSEGKCRVCYQLPSDSKD